MRHDDGGLNYQSWWSLDRHICNEVYQGVKALREHGHTHPDSLTPEQWHGILKGIEDDLFEYVTKDVTELDAHDRYVAKRGLRTFAEHLGQMWD